MNKKPYKLSKIDRKLLHLLELDARMPYSYYAKKLNLSPDWVIRRINSLIKENVIENFYTLINLPKINYIYCRVFLRYDHMKPDTEENLIKYLKGNPKIGWISLNDNMWDLTTIFIVNSLHELYKETNKVFYEYSSHIKNKRISIQMQLYHFNHNYLYSYHDYKSIKYEDSENKINIDDTDKKILRELSKNARISVLELSSKLSLSFNTVKYRIKNLIKKRVILGFKPKINTKRLGFEHYKVFLSLGKTDAKIISQIIAFLSSQLNVIYITQALGKYDLEFEVNFENQDEFNEFMLEFRNKFYEYLGDYETTRISSELYINYFPG